jgi:hypothetical protein
MRTDLTSVRILTNVDTKKEIAKQAKVSHDTVARVKFIRDNADEETKIKVYYLLLFQAFFYQYHFFL